MKIKNPTSRIFISAGFFLVFLFILFSSSNKVYASINNQIGIGSSGRDVSTLQQFLATDYSIYPEAVVSGHFGPLTEKAVLEFQLVYSLPQSGQVDGQTLAEINNLMSASFDAENMNVSLSRNFHSKTLSDNLLALQ